MTTDEWFAKYTVPREEAEARFRAEGMTAEQAQAYVAEHSFGRGLAKHIRESTARWMEQHPEGPPW